MPTEFINPNLHVILIHYPLGLLTLGALIEVFAFLWRRSTFRMAGRWMILIGALSLVPSATSGLYAMSDVNRTSDTSLDATWEQVRAESPVKGEAWEMMKMHGWYNAAGSAAILLLVVSYLAASDVFRRRMHFVYLILLLGGLAALVLGAWNGGEMIYRHGVGVEVVRQSGDSDAAPTASEATTGEESAAAEEQTQVKRGIEYYAPPLQVHTILAGLAVSLGLAAIGLSYRAGSIALTTTSDSIDINYALAQNQRPADPNHPTAAQLNLGDDPRLRVDVVRPPAARFWVLGALAGLAAALTGWWVLAQGIETWQPPELWRIVQEDAKDQQYRRMAHVVVGVGMVVLMLVLAIVARLAAARRIVLTLFVLLFLGSVGLQIWLGSVLMFDTPAGSAWKFNSESTPAPTTMESGEPATPPATEPATAPTTAPVAMNTHE